MYHSLVGRGKSSYDPGALRDVKLSASDVALKAVAGLPQVRGARSIVTGLCEGRASPCVLVPSLFLCLSVALCCTCSLSHVLSLPHTLYLSRAHSLSLTDSLAHSLSLQTAHGKADSCVSYNQYVVFDSSQLLPRFLVQVSTFLCALERKCLCAPKCVCGRERYGCVTTQRHAYFTTSSPHSVPHSTLCVCRQEFPRAKNHEI